MMQKLRAENRTQTVERWVQLQQGRFNDAKQDGGLWPNYRLKNKKNRQNID